VSKITKALTEQLSKALGVEVEVEVVDLNDPTDASPEAKNFINALTKNRREHRSQVAKMAAGLLNMFQQNCCEHPDHRRAPKDADDALAINNAMASVLTYQLQAMEEYTQLLYQYIGVLVDKCKEDIPKELKEHLKSLELEISASHSMLEAHFDLVSRPGKISYLNHYDKIAAMIKAWSEDKETGSHEAGRTH
jgi:hypothetical protein